MERFYSRERWRIFSVATRFRTIAANHIRADRLHQRALRLLGPGSAAFLQRALRGPDSGVEGGHSNERHSPIFSADLIHACAAAGTADAAAALSARRTAGYGHCGCAPGGNTAEASPAHSCGSEQITRIRAQRIFPQTDLCVFERVFVAVFDGPLREVLATPTEPPRPRRPPYWPSPPQAAQAPRGWPTSQHWPATWRRTTAYATLGEDRGSISRKAARRRDRVHERNRKLIRMRQG